MKLLDFPLIKLTFFFVIGIIVGYYFPLNWGLIVYAAVVAFLIILLAIVNRVSRTESNLFGFVTVLTFCLIGIFVFNIHDESSYKSHYSNLGFDFEKNHQITLKISKRLKPNFYQERFITELLKVDGINANGKVLINIIADSTNSELFIDDILGLQTKFIDINPPLNPGQFNYKKYLENQYILHQLQISPTSFISKEKGSKTLAGIASAIRIKINTSLKKHEFSKDELSIFNALLLGQREDISPEIYNSYVNAGVIHILAVSGLHIGILLLILQFLLKPLDLVRHGKIIKIIVIFSLLWSFAVIAGLSASVTRAVTMFSIIAIGLNLKRAVNIYNTLAISILILLLAKPMFLFDVGFQLSYLAVLGIVVLEPKIYGLIHFNWKFPNYVWKLFSVTLAAQIAVLPLSLYYFHQFPGLFFLSNLLIVPFLGIILSTGIIVIILSLLDLLPDLLFRIFAFLIESMNTIVNWTASKEQFLFQDISFNLSQLMAAYLIIIAIISLLIYKNAKSLIGLLASILIFQIIAIGAKLDNNRKELIVFHRTGSTYLGIRKSQDFNVYTNQGQLSEKPNFLRDYKIKNGLPNEEVKQLSNVYQFRNKSILIIDSLGIYNTTLTPNIVLITNSPKLNFNRLLDSIKPELIIADGSNYRSYIHRWKITTKNKKIPFHATAEKGAFVLKE